jgi:two-component system cell cycle sensor histidine kinase/response regulator CckA
LLRADIALRFDIVPELWVRADATQLQQVVMNLALNAQDAMPSGGRLTITIDSVMLDENAIKEIVGAHPGHHVRLTVIDTGTGMDAVTRARLFEPFYTTKPEGKGTGLGLAVVYGAVHQCGGSIDVTSRPGEGTTFVLYFPRVDAPHASATAQAPVRAAIAATRTIVLVEDQDAVRQALSRHLTRCGYHLHVFASPDELRARAGALDPRPDLLLSDVVLPGMNGVELARAVVPLWPGVRVLFMSGYTADVSVTAMQSVTEDTLITKPFRPAELVERIERVLASAPAWE